MLSNLVITNQRLLLIIDKIDQEKISHNFVTQLLEEQNQDKTSIKTLALSKNLQQEDTLQTFLNNCANNDGIKWNVILPSLSSLLYYQRPAVIFQFLHNLRKCTHVKRAFIWATIPNLPNAEYILAACEYIADLVLHLESQEVLSIIVRKPGGGVSNKRYMYNISENKFLVEPTKNVKKSPDKSTSTVSGQLGTFKIELDEDELVARNAIRMPYEKTEETVTGNIIYTPDFGDDFDEEDPDEDLCV